MKEQTAFSVWAQLLNRMELGTQERERASKQLDGITPVLPEPERWMTEGKPYKDEAAEGAALLLGGDMVFSVRLKIEPGQQRVILRSWPVVREQTRVERRQEAATHQQLGRGYVSTWTFETGGTQSHVKGFTTADGNPDAGDEFALALAARLGWSESS